MSSTFSKTETSQIVDLLDRFDVEICRIEDVSNENIVECYQSFFARIKNELESESEYSTGISDVAYARILKALSPELYNDFWTQKENILYQAIPNTDFIQDTIQSIGLSQGKYIDYMLNEVSPDLPSVAQYINALIPDMEISKFHFGYIAINYEALDVADERVRLLVAIHYLTLDAQERGRRISYDKFYKKYN